MLKEYLEITSTFSILTKIRAWLRSPNFERNSRAYCRKNTINGTFFQSMKCKQTCDTIQQNINIKKNQSVGKDGSVK